MRGDYTRPAICVVNLCSRTIRERRSKPGPRESKRESPAAVRGQIDTILPALASRAAYLVVPLALPLGPAGGSRGGAVSLALAPAPGLARPAFGHAKALHSRRRAVAIMAGVDDPGDTGGDDLVGEPVVQAGNRKNERQMSAEERQEARRQVCRVRRPPPFCALLSPPPPRLSLRTLTLPLAGRAAEDRSQGAEKEPGATGPQSLRAVRAARARGADQVISRRMRTREGLVAFREQIKIRSTVSVWCDCC